MRITYFFIKPKNQWEWWSVWKIDWRMKISQIFDQNCSTTIDWSASNQQDKGQDNNRWLARWCRRDPVASIRGHLVAGNDVLATKHKEEHHRDRDDREAVAGHKRWSRVATVLLATIRHRAPGLWNRTIEWTF